MTAKKAQEPTARVPLDRGMCKGSGLAALLYEELQPGTPAKTLDQPAPPKSPLEGKRP